MCIYSKPMYGCFHMVVYFLVILICVVHTLYVLSLSPTQVVVVLGAVSEIHQSYYSL